MLPTDRRTGLAASVSSLVLASGTLVCCALPILLVALGFGSLVATLTSSAPWLVTLSRHKEWTFLLSGVVLASAAIALYRPGRNCPADPALARACMRADRWARRLWWSAALIWAVAAFMAYAWLPLQLAISRG